MGNKKSEEMAKLLQKTNEVIDGQKAILIVLAMLLVGVATFCVAI